jgi:signal transduction histidine kinase
MFVSSHDLTLASILLVFAAIIATTFGFFVSASVTDGLRNLAEVANRLANGDLAARVELTGRDEISQVAKSFNDMAAKLQEMEEERYAIDKLRRDLIAWTSHDLRTPLTSIRVMVEALNDGLVSDEEMRKRYFQTIQAEVVSLNNLIDDLFELAQLDAGGLSFEMETHSLSDLISDTIESFQPIARKKDVTLNGEVGRELDPVIMNASRIERVLTNLVSNALNYAPPGGYVRLKAERIQSGVKVTIEDNGPGFADDEDLPFVFEEFYRGEQARSRATGGSGLGLAIANGIIDAHKGEIWAKNLNNGGAIVGFVLPDKHF